MSDAWTDADRIPAMSAAGGWAEAHRLAGELTKLRAERDALLPVVEAAKAWREKHRQGLQAGWYGSMADIVAAVDALQPTEGAQP